MLEGGYCLGNVGTLVLHNLHILWKICYEEIVNPNLIQYKAIHFPYISKLLPAHVIHLTRN